MSVVITLQCLYQNDLYNYPSNYIFYVNLRYVTCDVTRAFGNLKNLTEHRISWTKLGPLSWNWLTAALTGGKTQRNGIKLIVASVTRASGCFLLVECTSPPAAPPAPPGQSKSHGTANHEPKWMWTYLNMSTRQFCVFLTSATTWF